MHTRINGYDNHPADSRVTECRDGIYQTLSGRMGTGGGNIPLATIGRENEMSKTIVRRLMPIECSRLQGYPDGWVDLTIKEDMDDEELAFWNKVRADKALIDGKKYKPVGRDQMIRWYNSMVSADSNKYKALGNSIALPQWWWLAQKMRDCLPEKATLGSLFDGIGGFPCVWEETYGAGTARWASEIEPFPIAVTKERFKDGT